MRAFAAARGSYSAAARLLGLHPNYLHRLIRNLNLKALLKKSLGGRQHRPGVPPPPSPKGGPAAARDFGGFPVELVADVATLAAKFIALHRAGPPRPRSCGDGPSRAVNRAQFSSITQRDCFGLRLSWLARCAACLRVSALDYASGVNDNTLLSPRSPSRRRSSCRCWKGWSGMTSRTGRREFFVAPSFAPTLVRSPSSPTSSSANSWSSTLIRLKLWRRSRRSCPGPMRHRRARGRRPGFAVWSARPSVLLPASGWERPRGTPASTSTAAGGRAPVNALAPSRARPVGGRASVRRARPAR